jgi:hypothetical protein
MLRKIGTPTHAGGWWLVPVAALSASRVDTAAVTPARILETAGERDGRAFVELIATAFLIGRARKAEADLGLRNGVELVATRAVRVDGVRIEANHALVLRGAKDGLEVVFLEPVDLATRDEICAAVEERVRVSRAVPGESVEPPRSNWDVRDLLSELAQYRRIDDGADPMAFRIRSSSSARTMYVYLYGGQPDLIHFDLEDPSSPSVEWDAAVGRGSAKTKGRLLEVARTWLDEGRMIPSGSAQDTMAR